MDPCPLGGALGEAENICRLDIRQPGEEPQLDQLRSNRVMLRKLVERFAYREGRVIIFGAPTRKSETNLRCLPARKKGCAIQSGRVVLRGATYFLECAFASGNSATFMKPINISSHDCSPQRRRKGTKPS